MIKSCSECTAKCCSSGEGPWKKVSFKQWYNNSTTPDGYNTQCENFDQKSQLCTVWKTDLPLECVVYVCGKRIYTDAELKSIQDVRNTFRL